MSSATVTNATVDAKGVVRYEFDGILRAEEGSEIPAETITGLLSGTQIEEIEAAKITGQITETQIAPDAISTPKLQAGAVNTAKLAVGAATAEKIAVGELSAITANLGTVTAGIIQGPTIRTGTTGARVSLASTGLLAFNGANEEVLSFSTATGNLFVKGEIKAGSTVPSTTITGQLTNAQLKEIEAAKITGTIAETQIGPEAISTPKLKAGAVSTVKLAAAAVTAEKIAVAELSAITANLGTITAGTITGATFRTSATNPKVQMDSEGVRAINAEGATTAHLEPSGLKIRVISQEVPSEDRKIRWVDSEGKLVGSVYAARFGKVQEIWLQGAPQSGGTNAGANLQAALGNDTVTFSANLSATVANAEVDVFSGETHHRVTLWDKEERSRFLQLATLKKRVFNAGTQLVAKEATAFEITHGLGTEKVVADFTAQGANLITFRITEITNTKLKVACTKGTEAFTVHWWAVTE